MKNKKQNKIFKNFPEHIEVEKQKNSFSYVKKGILSLLLAIGLFGGCKSTEIKQQKPIDYFPSVSQILDDEFKGSLLEKQTNQNAETFMKVDNFFDIYNNVAEIKTAFKNKNNFDTVKELEDLLKYTEKIKNMDPTISETEYANFQTATESLIRLYLASAGSFVSEGNVKKANEFFQLVDAISKHLPKGKQYQVITKLEINSTTEGDFTKHEYFTEELQNTTFLNLGEYVFNNTICYRDLEVLDEDNTALYKKTNLLQQLRKEAKEQAKDYDNLSEAGKKAKLKELETIEKNKIWGTISESEGEIKKAYALIIKNLKEMDEINKSDAIRSEKSKYNTLSKEVEDKEKLIKGFEKSVEKSKQDIKDFELSINPREYKINFGELLERVKKGTVQDLKDMLTLIPKFAGYFVLDSVGDAMTFDSKNVLNEGKYGKKENMKQYLVNKQNDFRVALSGYVITEYFKVNKNSTDTRPDYDLSESGIGKGLRYLGHGKNLKKSENPVEPVITPEVGSNPVTGSNINGKKKSGK